MKIVVPVRRFFSTCADGVFPSSDDAKVLNWNHVAHGCTSSHETGDYRAENCMMNCKTRDLLIRLQCSISMMRLVHPVSLLAPLFDPQHSIPQEDRATGEGRLINWKLNNKCSGSAADCRAWACFRVVPGTTRRSIFHTGVLLHTLAVCGYRGRKTKTFLVLKKGVLLCDKKCVHSLLYTFCCNWKKRLQLHMYMYLYYLLDNADIINLQP